MWLAWAALPAASDSEHAVATLPALVGLEPGAIVGAYTLVSRVHSIPSSYTPALGSGSQLDLGADLLEGLEECTTAGDETAPHAQSEYDSHAIIKANRRSNGTSAAEGVEGATEATQQETEQETEEETPMLYLPSPFENELLAAAHRYLLHRRVQRGSHGEVWRAVRSDDGRSVPLIVKRMLPGEGLLSGLRERHFGSSLRGLSGVARFIEGFESDGSFWLVFRDEGLSLHSLLYYQIQLGGAALVRPSSFWLRLRREASGRLMRHLVRQTLEAVATLHERNVTHRDLKPANVIISLSSEEMPREHQTPPQSDQTAPESDQTPPKSPREHQTAPESHQTPPDSHQTPPKSTAPQSPSAAAAASALTRRVTAGRVPRTTHPAPPARIAQRPREHAERSDEAERSGASAAGGAEGEGASDAHSRAWVRLADFGSAVDAETMQPGLGMYPRGPSVAEETAGVHNFRSTSSDSPPPPAPPPPSSFSPPHPTPPSPLPPACSIPASGGVSRRRAL